MEKTHSSQSLRDQLHHTEVRGSKWVQVTAGRNVKWCSHYGKYYGEHLKNTPQTTP